MRYRYFAWGHCSACDDDNARLYRPDPSQGVRVVQYPALCRACVTLQGGLIV